MWDETLFRANIAWCDSDHIQEIEEKKSQTAHYWFDNRTFFRIKKGDKRGYTSNYPTPTAMEFHEPESDLFGGVDKLEVTYVLDHQETTIEDIAIVYRNRGEVEFRFSILDSENVESAVPAKTDKDAEVFPKKEITKLKRELNDEEIESEDEQ